MMYLIVSVVAVVAFILQIILFFKIWKMTNTIEKMYELQQTSSGYELVSEIDAAGFPIEKFIKKKK